MLTKNPESGEIVKDYDSQSRILQEGPYRSVGDEVRNFCYRWKNCCRSQHSKFAVKYTIEALVKRTASLNTMRPKSLIGVQPSGQEANGKWLGIFLEKGDFHCPHV